MPPTPAPPRRSISAPNRAPSPAPIDVDPRWIARALAVVLLVALACGYITLCLLFRQGQWQLVLHPSHQATGDAPLGGTVVHFAPDTSATPQLTGWWIPASRGGSYSRITLLVLRGGDNSLAQDTPLLAALHASGANILAFDYRGYGSSLGKHPTQLSMQHDAESAWSYLRTQRHVSARQIVPYGVGLGASLATHLTLDHGDTPALVLDAPAGDTLPIALASPATRGIPVRLLFHERFPLAAPLRTLSTPKLIITRASVEPGRALLAADPKITVALPPGSPSSQFSQALGRFFDEYLPATPVPQLQPNP